MNVDVNNRFIRWNLNRIHHYNHERYWAMRKEVINPNSKLPKLLRYWYLYRIKRMDAFNNASMGTDFGAGASFKTPPIFPHGLNGIIVGNNAIIGSNCTIYHQVTIAAGSKRPTTLGDNCFIGAGAKIFENVHIGNNVKIGTNAVVVCDLPDNVTAVGVPAKYKAPEA